MGALIIGEGYLQCCLLLEPYDYTWELESLITELWSTIEKANEEAPGHGRITRDMIRLASPSKPFRKAPKGR